MAEEKKHRISKVLKDLNIGLQNAADFLAEKGFKEKLTRNSKISDKELSLLNSAFEASKRLKEEAFEKSRSKANASDAEEGNDNHAENTSDKEGSKNISGNLRQSVTFAAKEEPEVMRGGSKYEVKGKLDLDKKKEKSDPVPEKKQPESKPEATDAKAQNTTPPKQEKVVAEKAESKPEAPQKPEKESAEQPSSEKKKEESAKAKTPKPDTIKTVEAPKSEATTQPKDKKAAEEKPAPKKEASPEAKQERGDKNKSGDSNKRRGRKRKSRNEARERDITPRKPEFKQEGDTLHVNKDFKSEEKPEEGENVIEAKGEKLGGLTVVGKVDLSQFSRKGKGKKKPGDDKGPGGEKRRRRRRRKPRVAPGAEGKSNTGQSQNTRGKDANKGKKPQKKQTKKAPPTEKEIKEQIRQTFAKLKGETGSSKQASRRTSRKQRREAHARAQEEEMRKAAEDAKTLRVTEFVPANELAGMMDVNVNQIISACFSLGHFVTINQRLEKDTIELIADEFGFNVEFTTTEEEADLLVEQEDAPEDLSSRAPIVTIMGHVDHGKTTLLDHIRSASVAEGEAGGITQHIGAYKVTTDDGREIAFLDTPGHEAFTAMRARGAKLTDVAIIVVAADDGVMPQTKEAINHAQVAEVPIVIAINKIDKPGANPERIKQELAELNILVEDWGGKYQSQEVSAKKGLNIEELLEKVLLEAEIQELKANSDKKAMGTVVEASLDKGRGYVATLMVQAGTLRVGDVVLAGAHYGKVRAMMDHRGRRLEEVGPSTPVQVLGLDGAPQAGDRFNVMDADREAREIATKRQQIQREQSIRATRRLTLHDIGRRRQLGSFQQLNLIVKGDVDGSVEAITDSLLKLSTEEVEVNIIHKAVGQISESDVLLSTASDAIIIGFQVRPSRSAKQLAEREEVEIRSYSIIYQIIDDIKKAIEGLLAPDINEVVLGTAEVREIFKISKIGTIAGCMVTDGLIKRNAKVRLVREGVIIYDGELASLKRFKDDTNEVKQGFDCGMSIKNFNDLKVGDELESYEEREVRRTLD